DVVGGQRLAVVELDVAPQVERPGPGLVGRLPRRREKRPHDGVPLRVDELLAGEVRDAERAERLQERRLEGTVDADVPDAERARGRAALGNGRRGCERNARKKTPERQ